VNWVLLCIILGNPKRLELLLEMQVAKSSGEGGEVVVVTCLRSLFAMSLFNSVAGIVASV
jgi:hypothetical protein